MLGRLRELEIDLVVCAGDLTNAEYKGMAVARRQIEEICSRIRSSGVRMIYVLGNRDVAGGRSVECPLPDDLSQKDIWVDGTRFTTTPTDLSPEDVFLTHALGQKYKTSQLPAKLVLYGHDHVPRVYKNYVGLGYMRDRDEENPDVPLGGFFLMDPASKGWRARFVGMGGLKPSSCARHADRGVFYVPNNWDDECPLCRNEDKYRFGF
jgi:predicted phosphodiesterase